MSLEPSVFPSALHSSDEDEDAPEARIIDTIGVEVVDPVEVVIDVVDPVVVDPVVIDPGEDIWDAPPANVNASAGPRLEDEQPIPFASTLRRIA